MQNTGSTTERYTDYSSHYDTVGNKYTSDKITIAGLLFFVGNIVGGRGWLGLIFYYLMMKDSLDTTEKKAIYQMFNFILSYGIYLGIALIIGVVTAFWLGTQLGGVDISTIVPEGVETRSELDEFLINVGMRIMVYPVVVFVQLAILLFLVILFSIIGLIVHIRGKPYYYPLSLPFFRA